MRLTYTLISLTLIFILTGCTRTIHREEKYYKWLNDESNHLKVVKQANDFKLTLKYMPPELLAFNEMSSNEENQTKSVNRDSLISVYNNSLTFLFTIEDKQDRDIMYYNVYSEQEFKQRIMELNFKLQDYISIKSAETEYVPVLCIMESTYETKNSRTFYIVFTDTDKSKGLLAQEKIDVVFNDLFFNTGISHFTFSKHDFENVPKIGFWK